MFDFIRLIEIPHTYYLVNFNIPLTHIYIICMYIYNVKQKQTDMKTLTIDFTRINNDVYGNPRYVCHFLNIDKDYATAVKLANSIGGRKYHTKTYGGGIVFQSYNLENLENEILNLKK